ncbi:MAG: tRNA pseudouridine(55) synthase TruB [Nitrospirae bacterium]|nr:tRNA pseudouridine(55) synthase TruB [Nitrospirota bacterium]
MSFVINFNKSRDISSQQAVIRVKKFFSAKKAGHAGTLDPMATGVLIVCLNEATKITRFLSELDKEYNVRVKLGERTDTFDLTGRLLEKKDTSSLREKAVQDVLRNFIGEIKQTPPMFSAIKIKGQPLYKLARRGIEIKRNYRIIHIYGLDLVSFDLPYIDLNVKCSKGTYVRTLCDDIGKALGVGAHVILLERTRVGNFGIEDSSTIEELGLKKESIHSIDSALSFLDEITLDDKSYHRAKNGMPVIVVTENKFINQYLRLKGGADNKLFGIGRVEDNKINIERLLN